jgi:hypothetical protein
MTLARPAGQAREHLGRRPTAQAIALVRSLRIVEDIEADQFAGLRGVHVSAPGPARPGELPPRPLGKEPTSPGTVVLTHRQAIPATRQARAAQEPLHRRGGHVRRELAGQVGGNAPARPTLATPAPRPGSAAPMGSVSWRGRPRRA